MNTQLTKDDFLIEALGALRLAQTASSRSFERFFAWQRLFELAGEIDEVKAIDPDDQISMRLIYYNGILLDYEDVMRDHPVHLIAVGMLRDRAVDRIRVNYGLIRNSYQSLNDALVQDAFLNVVSAEEMALIEETANLLCLQIIADESSIKRPVYNYWKSDGHRGVDGALGKLRTQILVGIRYLITDYASILNGNIRPAIYRIIVSMAEHKYKVLQEMKQ